MKHLSLFTENIFATFIGMVRALDLGTAARARSGEECRLVAFVLRSGALPRYACVLPKSGFRMVPMQKPYSKGCGA